MYRLPLDQLDDLFALLRRGGRTLVGPTERDATITLAPIHDVADLPRGRTITTAPGSVRVVDRTDDALFGYTVGPDAAKRWLHPPQLELWRAVPTEDGFTVQPPPLHPPTYAFVGLRACDLAALAIHDTALMDGPYVDPAYASRRADVLLVAVQCAESAPTCFCLSMHTGPRVTTGYDLSLTEVVGSHLVVEVGSGAGQHLVDTLGLAESDDRTTPEEAAEAAKQQVRTMPADARTRLAHALESVHYDDIAARCLGCSSCTMVCPTCFCTTTESTTELSGAAVHARRWDSCFDPAFTDLHGHAVRDGVGDRYRQWITHKLSTWHDQFDTSGCVGCGRCIAWCPAGIDLVAEALALGAPS